VSEITGQKTDKTELGEKRAQRPVTANVSNRHIHLCVADLEKLFGKGYNLTKTRDLMQPGEFASERDRSYQGALRAK